MDFVSPILDVASLICNCVGDRAVKVRRLPQNLNSLRTALKKLNNAYRDVKEKVEGEESLEKKRTNVVDGWIQSVEAIEIEVNELLAKGDEEIQKKCLCCPKNCRASYKLAKMVQEKMDAVAALQTEGNNFQEVAAPLPSPVVIGKPLEKHVGLDSPFHEVWRSLQDEQVRTIGIYGMGGVGKTTLLMKINNEFLKSSHDFDIVIWVVVSKPTNLQRVQETILSRLKIPEDRWKNRSENEKAEEICRVLNNKKFLLLLDDIWERLDLLSVGIPPLNDQNKSKIVFTTRSADVCKCMEAGKLIKVVRLAPQEAITLFQSKVGEDTLKSHPRIRKLSEMVAEMCKGLPLALIVIARAMAQAKTPEEWERKMQMLRDYPDQVTGTENDLFQKLAFSYDSLPDEAIKPIKPCFLYCALFPEDYEISSLRLMQLWIGEGFLDECNMIQGQEIIESLKDACLLEHCRFRDEEEYLKMHDVIRDMALWLACEKGKKKNKFVVKDGVGLIRAREVEKWEDTQRISLWNSSIEELREPPYFPKTETFLGSGNSMVPNGFFTNMPVIRVLDLSFNEEFTELPVEIGNLVTLQYLNLSGTEINYIPEEFKNLKKLRYLILDQTYSLEPLPSQMISSLSSLRLFSMYHAYETWKGDDERKLLELELLEELEQLEHIDDISIDLTSVLSTQTLFNSHRLQRFIRRLQLYECKGMNLVQLSPYIETLQMLRCVDLEDVKIYWEKEVQVYSKFSNLRYVTIEDCEKLSNLTCLIYASSLQFLEVRQCGSMEKVIEDERSEVSEIEQDSSVFSRLTSLTLWRLPKLRSIYGRGLPFPSLRYIEVMTCPSLKRMPFDSSVGTSKKLEKIVGEQEWWEGLEWEDQTIMHHLTPYFRPPQPSSMDEAFQLEFQLQLRLQNSRA